MILTPSHKNVVTSVEKETGRLGKDGVLASLSPVKEQSSEVYILQRWSEKWNTYIDVTDVAQIANGNRLTITSQQPSPKKASGSDFATVQGKVGDIGLLWQG